MTSWDAGWKVPRLVAVSVCGHSSQVRDLRSAIVVVQHASETLALAHGTCFSEMAWLSADDAVA